MAWLISIDSSEPIALAGGRLYVEAGAQLRLEPGLSDGSTVEIDLAYDRILGRVVATSIRVERASEGEEITTRRMHEIKVQNALIKVVMNDMLHVVDANGMAISAAKALDHFETAKGRSRVDQVRDAAIIYTIATVANWPPLKTVAERLEVSQSTATRLVAEAREHGELTDG